MKKIKITTDRTWVGGKKAEKGQTYDVTAEEADICLLYTSPSPRDGLLSRMPSSA